MDREIVLKSFLENAELLKKRNSENIEKYRKGEFSIVFSDEKPRKITVKQTKHAFLFGCNAFMLDSFETPEKEPVYKEKFAKLFNQAVVPFYWTGLEPTEGNLRFHKNSEKMYRRPTPDYVLEFCKEYDFGRLFHSCSYYFGAANPVGKFYQLRWSEGREIFSFVDE
jgi:hypothetical protein